MNRNSNRARWIVRFAALALTAAVVLVKPSLVFATFGDWNGGENLGCIEAIWDALNGNQPPE